MKRKLKIFTYGFYIGMILWMCGLVASMIVDNVTIKMLMKFVLKTFDDVSIRFRFSKEK